MVLLTSFTETNSHISIIGAGPVGTLTAILLAQKGYSVTIFEKRPDPRIYTKYNGRSINLALSERGLLALEQAGLSSIAKEVGVSMFGRMVHTKEGTNFQPYGKDSQCIYSVSRAGLNHRLIEVARENERVTIHFDQEFVDWREDSKELLVKNKLTQETISYPSDILIGSDGAASLVRHLLENNGHTVSNVQHFPFGYKEADIPAGDEGAFLMEKNALHIWPQKNFMLIALPNTNGTFTCTLFLAEEGPVSFQNLNSLTDYENFVTVYFPDLKELIPTVAHQLFENPVSGLHSISCYPWSVSGATVLIGDAAHAILPFYGQGMNAGFEDARILSELVDEYSDNWKEIIPKFEQIRKPNADAIKVLAENNFIEMRDLVSDPHFLLKKRLEKYLVEWTQGHWIPQYTMVTFSHMPYEEALRKGQYQDHLLENIIQEFSIQSDSDWGKLESPVLSYLKKMS